ncbi:MAG: sigma 54-interacting transcriptional regulator [Bacillota bacterium]|nr:sigma 54-interacting transcriptional regulator [Bacillota bacterium]MDW7676970.1 sigma 54-interacting transcriptional regulator [Bacillota bacterium]
MQLLDHFLNRIPGGLILMKENGEVLYQNEKANVYLQLLQNKIGENREIVAFLNRMRDENQETWKDSKDHEILIQSYLLGVQDGQKTIGVMFFEAESLSNLISNASTEEFKMIFDSAQDAMFIDDKDGITQWMNKAASALYQVSKEDVIGKSIEEQEKSGLFYPSVAKMAFMKKEEVTILHNNRHGKKLMTTGTPIFDKRGNIQKIITTSRDMTELISLKNELEDVHNTLEELKEEQQERIGSLIIKSKKMKDLVQLAKRLAQIDSTVLITGESGVGKGEIAKFIHLFGENQDRPFVKVNCGAIPESLLESELFGYESGAFTGSKKQGKPGLFEMAQEGTIFLDEISELPLNLQVKLLHAIQDKEIQRVGGIKPIQVNVRIITATNQDLNEMVRQHTFREDLYYRLNVVPISIPPLRERKEDIFPLVTYFLQKYNEKFMVEKRLDSNAIDILLRYSWPGNVRELENIIERIVITTKGQDILPENLPGFILGEDNQQKNVKLLVQNTLKQTLEEVEKQVIAAAAVKHRTTREIAKALNVSQPTIVRKMNKYHL